MANPWAGEAEIVIGGVPHVARLTLGALAELEEALGEGGLVGLVERFESGRFSARDVLRLLAAGLRGGGWTGTEADLARAEIAGGVIEASRTAARLLALAFRMPEAPDAGSTGRG
ncbi:MAG: gene transfer agent family protein [Rhodobacteraceae bacterium]|nr:gene transfer agent family protein [Paracoccaceae bacterium]